MEVVVARDVVDTVAANMAVVDVVVVTEPVVARILKRELERVETPFVGETLPGGEGINILPHVSKDNLKSYPVFKCLGSWTQSVIIPLQGKFRAGGLMRCK